MRYNVSDRVSSTGGPITRQAVMAEDTIDGGPLGDSVGYALRRAQLAVFQDFFACFAGLDLRPAEFSVLLIVQRNPGLQQGRVAEALGIQPPNFAVLLRRLTARGLAEQRASPHSRRAVALHLTPAGNALLDRALAAMQTHEQRITDRLGPARRALLLELLHDLIA
jgi:DNA-binding MarR family transcriptional regulator